MTRSTWPSPATVGRAAEGGPEALAARVPEDLAALPGVLAPVLARERDPDTVHIPWQGWSLSTDDFLVTRLMEIVVHSDDLAASVGLPTPTSPTRWSRRSSRCSRRSRSTGTGRRPWCGR